MKNREKTLLERYLPHLALVGCNLLWAFDYPLYHILLPHYLSPMALLFLALLFTALFAIFPLLGRPRERVERRDLPLFVLGALLIGLLHKGFMMKGLSLTSPIDASIINTAGPLVVLFLSVLMGRDRLTSLKVIGLALGLIGAVAVILWGGNEAHQSSDLRGNLMMVGAVTATALYTVWLKQALVKYRVTTILAWVYGIAALLSLPLGVEALWHTPFATWTLKGWLALVAVLLLLTYLPNFLFNLALKRIKPLETSIFSYLQPVAAIFLSVAMGLDRLQFDTIIFAVVIFVGIGLVLFSYAKGEASPSAKGRDLR